ncbi:MAG: glycosyltransferase [Bacteroidota bacterium]
MITKTSKRFLVAPLDWGLGHTTRIIPFIRYLHTLKHTVVFAGNEAQRQFISQTFPNIDTLHLDGYAVHYSKSRWAFMPSMLAQVPRLLGVLRKEHQWLLQQCATQHFDAIISDNRYGLYHPTIPSVILTHQLQILTGLGFLADNELQRIHYGLLKKFNSCWVVDVPASPNLSGKLAHPSHPLPTAKYLGLLSQLQPTNVPTYTGDHLLILLSGPEPQRTILASLLWQQALEHKGKVVFVEGSTSAIPPAYIPPHIQYHSQLTASALQPILSQAAMVICRSGYSTLMDLVAMHKKAILIPTPGQTEQEYLAKHLHAQGVFYSHPQKGFDLSTALFSAAQFPYKSLHLSDAHNIYKYVIDAWLKNI